MVVVNDTTVPFCTGVPAPGFVVLVGVVGVVVPPPGVVGVVGVVAVVPFSMTVTTISMSPLIGTVFAAAKIEITEPVGAVSGTLSQPVTDRNAAMPATAAPVKERFMCDNIRDAKDNTLMGLAGQGSERGYAMAALLVSIGVMMVVMTVAMPVWRTQAQREKEAELVFRGEQIARGINLYMRKMGGGNYPPSLDVLVQGRFIRKKYKDPMTKDGEWDVILAAGGVPGQGGPAQQTPGIGRGRTGAPSTGLSAPASRNSAPSPSPFSGGPGAGAGGGIMGVRSKSKESAFRLYKGSGTHYNEWLFLFSSVSNRPGAAGGQAAPGMPGRGGSSVPGMPVGPGGRRGQPGSGPDGGRGPRGFGPGMGTTPGTGTPQPIIRPPGGQ